MAKLPNIIGIGAQKAGTTWLHKHLSSHPDIWAPPFKELHFFDHKFIPESREWTPWHINKAVKKEIENEQRRGNNGSAQIEHLQSLLEKPFLNGTWYKRIYSQCPEPLNGIDITPEYSSLPPEGIDFMARFLKRDVKIIYIIRDPIERALSQVRMNIARHGMPKSDVEWMDAAQNVASLERGNYLKNVSNWDESRLKDNVLYCSFKDIHLRPEKLLENVENFCGIRNWAYEKVTQKVFATKPVPVPDAVRDFLSETMHPQYQFLEDRFGSDFL